VRADEEKGNFMKENAAYHEWTALYQAAAEFREIEPWKWVEETDIFGVQNPRTGETGYCCIMGAPGELLGMAVYLGTEGLQAYKDIYEDMTEPHDPDIMFTQNCIVVSFEDRGSLQAKDKELIKKTGLKFRGRRSWPMFRRHEPGYFPWFLEGEDVSFMTEVMRQAKDVCLRLGKDEEILSPPKGGAYLVRVFNSAEDLWKDAWHKPSPAREKAFPPIVLDDLRLLRIKKNAKPSTDVWEVDFFYSPTPVESERPYFPYAMMVADSETGIINDIYLAEGQDHAAGFSERLISCIEKTEKMPSEIRVRRKEILNFLQPIAEKLSIPSRLVSKLPAIEEARRSIEGHFQKDELPPGAYCGDALMEKYLEKAGAEISIFGLYGLIYGCLAAPNPVTPSVLMPVIFGEEGADFETKEQAQKTIGNIMALWNRLSEWDPQNDGVPFPKFDYPLNREGALQRIADALDLADSFFKGLAMGGIGSDDLPEELKKYAAQIERVSSLLYSEAKLLREGHASVIDDEVMKAIDNGELVIDGCITNIHAGLKNARMRYKGEMRAVDAALTSAGVATNPKVGRNEPCPCGSGKKFKKCCELPH
jgi:hypothetical protein